MIISRMTLPRGKKNAIKRTANEYAGQSTVHGVGYIFDRELSPLDRVLWFLFCLGLGCLAIHWTKESFTGWRNNQIITTLKNTAKPVTELEFPTLASCTDGLHMESVERALWNCFDKWVGNRTKGMTDPKDIPTHTIHVGGISH
jgi:hypothetical protein